MRSTKFKIRGLTAITAAIVMSAGIAFSQEDGKPKAKKPADKAEAQKKSPAPAQAKKAKPKEPAKKTANAEAKVEIRVRPSDGRDHGKAEIVKRHGVQMMQAPKSSGQDWKPRPWLGIAMRPIPDPLREYLALDEGFGVQVDHVAGKSPADEAGLQVHDILTKLDDQRIISPEHVALLVRSKKKGAKIDITFIRKGKEQTAEVTLGERDLPPFSDAPMRVRPPQHPPMSRRDHDRDIDDDGDDHDGSFEFRFGEPGKEGHFEFRLPGDEKDHEELRRHLKGYGDILKQWMEKNPDMMLNWDWDLDGDDDTPPNKPKPQTKPRSPKATPPDSDAAAAAKPKPIPPLPGKGSHGRPPSIMVRPGLPLEVFGAAGVVKIDNLKGDVTITATDGDHKITIKNSDGETVYEGPFDTEKGPKGLPKEAQAQLKEMKLEDLKLMMPRTLKIGPKADLTPSKPKSGNKGAIL